MKKTELDNQPELIEKIKEIYGELNSIRKTKDKVNKNFNLVLNYHDIRYAINELKSSVEKLSENIEEIKKYEIEGDEIVFYKKKKNKYDESILERIPISVEELGNIVFDYSREGGNLSGPSVRKKYNISVNAWNLIKSRLDIFKDSNACPDVVLDFISNKYGEEAVEEKIVESSARAISSKYGDKYKKHYEDLKKKDYIAKSKILATINNTLEYIQGFLTSYEPKVLDFDIPSIQNSDEIEVLFSDIHLGKMNSDEVIRRLKEMTRDLKERPEKIIHLICLGDIFENLVKGGMHIGQVETMDGPHGFELLMLGVEMLESMIIELYKAGKDIKFYGIGGNHDRFTSNKDDGFAGIGAYITYELVKRGLNNIEVEVNILKETWNILDLDEVRYIIHHGDNGVARKGINNGEKILWEYGDSSKFNILATADQHHLESKNQSDKSLSLIVPALAGRNEFDTKIGLSSNPGYIIVKRNKSEVPDINIKLLK